MFKIDLKSKKSIYEQVVDGFKDEIISGVRAADSKIPSVRELAASLTVNPNTIQKAYTELEKQGYIYSVSGRGNFVSGEIKEADPKLVEDTFSKMEMLVRELKFLGLTAADVQKGFEKILVGFYEKNDFESKGSTDIERGEGK